MRKSEEDFPHPPPLQTIIRECSKHQHYSILGFLNPKTILGGIDSAIIIPSKY